MSILPFQGVIGRSYLDGSYVSGGLVFWDRTESLTNRIDHLQELIMLRNNWIKTEWNPAWFSSHPVNYR